MTLLEKFDLDQQRRGLQPNTVDLRHGQIERFNKGAVALTEATPDQIQEWLDNLRTNKDLPISEKTRSCYLTTFSAFFKWGIKHDELTVNPIEKIDRPRVHNGMPNPISEADLEHAIASCGKSRRGVMVKAWIVIEAFSGLRCQEVAFLTYEDIQTAEDRIYVRHGKGGHQRYVSGIHPRILEVIDEYKISVYGCVPRLPCVGRMWPLATPASVSQRINRHYHQQGITKTAHKNRHRFGTRLLAVNGGNLLAAQRALGHANVSTTQIYVGIDDSEVRAGVLAL